MTPSFQYQLLPSASSWNMMKMFLPQFFPYFIVPESKFIYHIHLNRLLLFTPVDENSSLGQVMKLLNNQGPWPVVSNVFVLE